MRLGRGGECPLAAGFVCWVFLVGGCASVVKDVSLAESYAVGSVSWLREQSKSNKYAQTILGFFHLNGIAMPQNKAEAI